MGSYVSKCNICQSVPIGTTTASHIKSEKATIKILLLGLDNAGKTTTALHLIGDSLEDIIPTIGFSNLEMKKYEKYKVVVYDLGGGARIRGIWKNYFALIHGIIFVIDSSDISRVLEVKDVIEEVVSNDKIAGKPILVLINKQDIEGALEELDLCQYLKLESLINKFKCPTKVETCSANRRPQSGQKIDPSIDTGYQWLLNFIAKNWLQLNNRVELNSNEQYSNERKSLEERVNRFRVKRFESEDNEFINEKEFIKNGNPFKAIGDVVRDVEQTNEDMNSNSSEQLLKYSQNNSPTIEKNDKERNAINEDKESISKLGSASEENLFGHNSDTNESNDILTNNLVSDEKMSASDKTSGVQQTTAIDRNTTDAELHHNHNEEDIIEEEIIKSQIKQTKDLESYHKRLSPQSSEKSNNSNRSENHKKVKRKIKVIRNSKVSPDLSKNS